MPAWTGPGWTTVLRGAVSHRNRSPFGLAALGPSPAHTARNGVGGGADGADVDARVQGSQAGDVDMRRGPEIVQRLAVDDHADVDPLTPVDARNRVQHGVLEGIHCPAPGGHVANEAARAARYST
jgi:hypothetical protein